MASREIGGMLMSMLTYSSKRSLFMSVEAGAAPLEKCLLILVMKDSPEAIEKEESKPACFSSDPPHAKGAGQALAPVVD